MCAEPRIKMLSGRNGIIYQTAMMLRKGQADCTQIKT